MGVEMTQLLKGTMNPGWPMLRPGGRTDPTDAHFPLRKSVSYPYPQFQEAVAATNVNMQVVYSGGSTTPSPSPRLQRKQMQGYGRPVLPGYLTGPPPISTHHRSKEEVHKSEGDKSLRDSIPAMSKPLAVICLICNIILPGLECNDLIGLTPANTSNHCPRQKESK
ncbi:hypothetical protein LOTGIDRAFT_169805 [Lottia gigantea]|uniref:Uncharacterized protein n=1 Tax=Lottia gigantea TaxID=225164 RepID=V3ZKQ9_LOTGI|nr:hypothetical protein LOTGIDRAFT_169805 [Lottia gigantea]ESO82980.1 hypothetical protein LOTGIDRAFT_169805 [Lottia gigantea]